MCAWVSAQPCLTLCNPTDYSPQGSSIHGIFKARIPDWVVISYSNTLCLRQIINKDVLYSSFGFKLGKQYIKAIYCHPAYLTSMQSTSCKMPGWVKYKLESRFWGEISITSDTQRTPHLMAQSEEELKSLLMRVKDKSEEADLKLNIQKLRSWHLAPLLHCK